MVLARFVLLAAFLLAASSVSAAVTIDLGPSDWRRWGEGTSHHHTRGLNTKFGQTVRMPPLNTNLTVTRNAVIPYGSIANGAKNFLRVNPASIAASAAFTGMFLALDWAWDELNQGWGTYEEQLLVDPALHIFEYTVHSPSGTFELSAPTGPLLCEQIFAPNGPYGNYTYTGWNGQTNHCTGHWPSEPWRDRDLVRVNRVGQCPSHARYDADLGGCVTIDGEFEHITDSQIRELEDQLPFFPAATVGSAAWDAMERQGAPLNGYSDMQMEGPASTTGPETSTTTVTETGDTVVTTTTTTTNYQYGDTTITTTNTTVTNTYTNGNHTSTETTTETPGELPVTEPSPGGTAGEWPGFCDWASVVCNFIDWFQEPFDAPEVEWPLIEDQDYEEEFNYTLAASCPEPYTIELALFPPVQFNWQPFCDLATFIKPLVLASAAIFAAFISLGIARART